MNNEQPIGFFDSGVGGLTVMREVAGLLPRENLIYLGDTARLPYGNKSPATVIRYARENAEFLRKQQIKLLVISCHTACCQAFSILSQSLSIPVVGVTMPGFQALAKASKTGCVAVLGTASTIGSGVFQSLLQTNFPQLEVHAIACPLFVPLVEDGLHSHAAAELLIEHYLSPLKKTKVDAILLACTHYPLLSTAMQDYLGPHVALVQPARYAALEAQAVLENGALCNENAGTPSYRFYSTDDPGRFRELAKTFFPYAIGKVELA